MFHKFAVVLLLQKNMESGTYSHEKRSVYAESEDLLKHSVVEDGLFIWKYIK